MKKILVFALIALLAITMMSCGKAARSHTVEVIQPVVMETAA